MNEWRLNKEVAIECILLKKFEPKKGVKCKAGEKSKKKKKYGYDRRTGRTSF